MRPLYIPIALSAITALVSLALSIYVITSLKQTTDKTTNIITIENINTTVEGLKEVVKK